MHQAGNFSAPTVTGVAAQRGIEISHAGFGSPHFSCSVPNVTTREAAQVLRDKYGSPAEEVWVEQAHSRGYGVSARISEEVTLSIEVAESPGGVSVIVSLGRPTSLRFIAEVAGPEANGTNLACMDALDEIRSGLAMSELQKAGREARRKRLPMPAKTSGTIGRTPRPDERVGGPDAHGWGSWQIIGFPRSGSFLARYAVSQPLGTINVTGPVTIYEDVQLQYGICLNVSNGWAGGDCAATWSAAGTTAPSPTVWHWYNAGTRITLSAIPNSGYTFTDWGCGQSILNATGGAYSCYGGSQNNYTITLVGGITENAEMKYVGGGTTTVTTTTLGSTSTTSLTTISSTTSVGTTVSTTRTTLSSTTTIPYTNCNGANTSLTVHMTTGCSPFTVTLNSISGQGTAYYYINSLGYSLANFSENAGQGTIITAAGQSIDFLTTNVIATQICNGTTCLLPQAHVELTQMTPLQLGCYDLVALNLSQSQGIGCYGDTKLLAVGSDSGGAYAEVGVYVNGVMTNETYVYAHGATVKVTTGGNSIYIEAGDIGPDWAFLMVYPAPPPPTTTVTTTTTTTTTLATVSTTTIPQACNTYSTLFVGNSVACGQFNIKLTSVSSIAAFFNVTSLGYYITTSLQTNSRTLPFTVANQTINLTTTQINSTLKFANIYIGQVLPPIYGCNSLVVITVGQSDTCGCTRMNLAAINTYNGVTYGVVNVYNANGVLTNATAVSPQWPTVVVNSSGHLVSIAGDTIGSNWESLLEYPTP